MVTDSLIRCLTAPNPSPLTGDGTNTYLIGSRDIAVIDPGPDLDAHLETILASIGPGGRISQIIVTHAHRDHSALAHRLATHVAAPVLAFGDALSGRSPRMEALAPLLGQGGEGLDLPFTPDQQLRDGDRITGAEWDFQVHHTPGHLGGHLCIALGQTLFSGDHVMGWSTSIVAPPDGDMADYMASLHRLSSGTWQRFLPGHGAPIEDPAARLQALIDHRLQREAAILAELANGPARIPELAARIYQGTPRTLLPAAERNIHAHLVDLDQKGLVSATPAPLPGAVYARR